MMVPPKYSPVAEVVVDGKSAPGDSNASLSVAAAAAAAVVGDSVLPWSTWSRPHFIWWARKRNRNIPDEWPF